MRLLCRVASAIDPDQLAAMLGASDDLLAMSRDPKNPLCAELSRTVVASVGRLMLDVAWEPPAPVLWLNHDVVARRAVSPAAAGVRA